MINYITAPFKWFFKLEAASGLMLLIFAVIALILSNSALSDYYFNTLNNYILIGTKSFGLNLSILHWINDVLMAIFFFVVTLEIKREQLKRTYLRRAFCVLHSDDVLDFGRRHDFRTRRHHLRIFDHLGVIKSLLRCKCHVASNSRILLLSVSDVSELNI